MRKALFCWAVCATGIPLRYTKQINR
jgi:hypothetical protein